MSWIARADLLRMIMNAIDDPRYDGAVNAVAPEPLRQADFQRALARTLKRPMFLVVPGWALTFLLGEMRSIFLASQCVVPTKALRLGFGYDQAWAADALDLQLGPPPRPLPTVVAPLHVPVPPVETAASDQQDGDDDDDHGVRGEPVPLRAQGAGSAQRKRA
jgi:hypothetical protein